MRSRGGSWPSAGVTWACSTSASPATAIIDFDVVTRDPARPTRFLPAFDSGDHLHPNDAGYQAMADAIDLRLLRNRGD